ncbi:DNA topoisomerase [Cellvibrio sp. UBA7671]|uniref:type IA DNA topoisomerase n=1 Tax=Cellvibrio sp. UBA7671 TaxID=1946312 RepID=UPI002F34FAFB
MPQQRVLMIVESPNKAKKIRGYFPDFKLIATVGHFKDLPRESMGVEPPKHQPEYVVSEGKQSVVTQLKAAAKDADIIYVATDPDREGEAIAAHVVNTLGKAFSNKISRITYTEISKKAIEGAIQAKRNVDWPLVRAQEARRVLDRYVGYLVSPELTRKFKAIGVNTFSSAGRVQSVAVKLVDERQREIDAFKPVKHFGVVVSLVKAGIEFEAVWKHALKTGELVTDVNLANAVIARTHTLKVTQVASTPRRVPAPKPLITSSYIRLMGAALRMTTKAAMDSAQKLFEAGLITYHRTDSPTMSADFAADIRAFALRNQLPVPGTIREVKLAANAQQGHECLRVTDIELSSPGAAGIDDPLLKAVYELVWMITLQSQLSDGENLSTAITFENGAKDSFISKALRVKHLGWRAAANLFKQNNEAKAATSDLDSENEEKLTPSSLPELSSNESLTPRSVTLQTKLTEAPSIYTEKTLVEKLEKLGIGRPSTYASTIERILQLNYVDRNKKTLQITPLPFGTAMVNALDKKFSFMEYSYTAEIEMEFDLIAQRKAEYLPVVNTAFEALQQELERFKSSDLSSKAQEHLASMKPSLAAAPIAKSSKAPSSASTQPSTNTAVSRKQCMPGDKCPECKTGTASVKKIKEGKNVGRSFIGCSNFPNCRLFSWLH